MEQRKEAERDTGLAAIGTGSDTDGTVEEAAESQIAENRRS